MVWVQANEAAEICKVMDKRLCDAHEWEGACHGELGEAEYPFDSVKNLDPEQAMKRMRALHNAKHAPNKKYAYGGSLYKKRCLCRE